MEENVPASSSESSTVDYGTLESAGTMQLDEFYDKIGEHLCLHKQ